MPFVSVFWHPNPEFKSKCKSAGSWDTHGNNFNCLKDFLLPEFDQAFATLIEDMAERGSLDQTLLLVNSEMGRMPKVGDRRSGGVKGAGRDHWTHCMSVLMAGGGIRGGQTYGKSDRHAEYPADLPVAPEDISKTIYYAMGYGGNGVMYSAQAGKRLAQLIAGKGQELDLPIFTSPLPSHGILTPFRRMGQRMMYPYYYLRDEVL